MQSIDSEVMMIKDNQCIVIILNDDDHHLSHQIMIMIIKATYNESVPEQVGVMRASKGSYTRFSVQIVSAGLLTVDHHQQQQLLSCYYN